MKNQVVTVVLLSMMFAGCALLKAGEVQLERNDSQGRLSFVAEEREVLWDAWPISPRAALAALALLSWIGEPEAHPEAVVLGEEIFQRLIEGN